MDTLQLFSIGPASAFRVAVFQENTEFLKVTSSSGISTFTILFHSLLHTEYIELVKFYYSMNSRSSAMSHRERSAIEC